MIRALVAGANGFLGRRIVDKCLELNWTVDALVNINRGSVPKGISNVYHSNDLNVMPAGYDYVFNAAAFIPYGAYHKPDERLNESNVLLPQSLHLKFTGAKIVYASSVSVYGNNAGLLNENSEVISPNAYGLSKLHGEQATAVHAKYSVVRFSSLYGAGMFDNTFIPRIINDAKLKRRITLLGDGERLQNYLHVSDAGGYCIHAALYGGNEIYLGVDVRSYSNKAVAEIICDFVPGCTVEYKGEDNSPSYEFRNEYTLKALKFKPGVTLQDGLKELING